MAEERMKLNGSFGPLMHCELFRNICSYVLILLLFYFSR